MSGGGDTRIQAAPLMSDLQLASLDRMLQAALNQMQGFTLGAPYGGASSQSYTPGKFFMPNINPTFENDPWRGGGGGGNGGGGNEGGGGDEPGAPEGPGKPRRGPRGREREREPNRRGNQAANSSWVSPWTSIFASLSPENLPPVPNEQQLMNTLTSPFAKPFTYSQTGNYPKR